ncbi:MAG: hypothetical protein NWF10_02350 [Candidatus Bathyarchaeota archaeon]|nr:hypothetical protein [Candidatus Bathyarchaeota archaeon]
MKMENKNKHQISKTNSKNIGSAIRKFSFFRIQKLFQHKMFQRKLSLASSEWNNSLQIKTIKIESELLKGKGLAYIHASPIR